jgi:hypothetical protein
LKEKQIEKEFVDWCEEQKYLCLKLVIEGQRYFPDRTVFLPSGTVMFFEFKKPKGKLSKGQKEMLLTLCALGFNCHVVTSADAAKDLVKGG